MIRSAPANISVNSKASQVKNAETSLPGADNLQERNSQVESSSFNGPGAFSKGFDLAQVPAKPEMRAGLSLQRCTKGGGSCSCPKCKAKPAIENSEEEEKPREASDGSAPQRSAATADQRAQSPAAANNPETTQSVEEDTPATPQRQLIVDESTADTTSGQMTKTEFLQQLRAEICSSIGPVLARAGQTTEGCPYLNYWLNLYEEKSAAEVEATVRRYAPASSNSTTAAGYISVVTERALRAAEVWASTGRITGVPEGVSDAPPGEAPPAPVTTTEVAATGTPPVMTKARDGGAKHTDDPSAIQQELGNGQALDAGIRARMETAFGASFSHVRTHTDSNAASVSNRVNARAFTVGNHVAFGSGEYSPGTAMGDALIAHELAHVVQQKNAPQVVDKMEAGTNSYNALESDADKSAAGVMASLWGGAKDGAKNLAQQAMPRLRSGLRLQGCRRNSEGGSSSGTSSTAGTGTGTGGGTASVRTLRVSNSAASKTFNVPSNNGASGKNHWVTPQREAGAANPIIEADTGFPATDARAAGLTWQINGTAAPSSGDALHLEVPRTRGKKVITATLGGATQELTFWSVFANLAAAGTPALSAATSATRFSAGAVADFSAPILPAEIITDADHPALEGANTTAPPDNGTQICGRSLAGGADHKWDVSRRTRQNVLNPAGIVPIPASDACLWTSIPYPANVVEGNDDTHAGDENNDPYANGAVITSHDPPSDFILHSQGADGNTLEIRVHFQEIARLELNRNWFLVSDLVPWRLHIKTRKDATTHRWVDDGTSTALDNSGF